MRGHSFHHSYHHRAARQTNTPCIDFINNMAILILVFGSIYSIMGIVWLLISIGIFIALIYVVIKEEELEKQQQRR